MFAARPPWSACLVACMGFSWVGCTAPAAGPDTESTSTAGPGAVEPTRSPVELLGEAHGFYERGELERAAQAFQVVAWFAEREGDARVTVEALSMVSRCHGLLGDLEGMRRWLVRTEEHASVSESRGWSATLLARGFAQRTVGDSKAALETFSELWTLSQAHGYERAGLEAARQASEVAPGGQRVRWAQRGLELTNGGDASVGSSRFDAHEQLVSRWVLGRAQRRDGALEDAQTSLEQVLLQARSRSEADPGPRATEWVGHALRELGEVAAARGDDVRAVRFLNEALVALEQADMDRNWARGMAALRRRVRELEQAQ